MRSVTKVISFDVPVDPVWKIWLDVEKTPEWVDGVLLSRRMSDEKEGPGLKWREKCVIGQQEIQVDHEITLWLPREKVGVLARLPFGGRTEREVSFKRTAGGCEVTIFMTWNLGIAASFFSDDEMEAMLERSLNRTAQKWKELAEEK